MESVVYKTKKKIMHEMGRELGVIREELGGGVEGGRDLSTFHASIKFSIN